MVRPDSYFQKISSERSILRNTARTHSALKTRLVVIQMLPDSVEGLKNGSKMNPEILSSLRYDKRDDRRDYR